MSSEPRYPPVSDTTNTRLVLPGGYFSRSSASGVFSGTILGSARISRPTVRSASQPMSCAPRMPMPRWWKRQVEKE